MTSVCIDDEEQNSNIVFQMSGLPGNHHRVKWTSRTTRLCRQPHQRVERYHHHKTRFFVRGTSPERGYATSTCSLTEAQVFGWQNTLLLTPHGPPPSASIHKTFDTLVNPPNLWKWPITSKFCSKNETRWKAAAGLRRPSWNYFKNVCLRCVKCVKRASKTWILADIAGNSHMWNLNFKSLISINLSDAGIQYLPRESLKRQCWSRSVFISGAIRYKGSHKCGQCTTATSTPISNLQYSGTILILLPIHRDRWSEWDRATRYDP